MLRFFALLACAVWMVRAVSSLPTEYRTENVSVSLVTRLSLLEESIKNITGFISVYLPMVSLVQNICHLLRRCQGTRFLNAVKKIFTLSGIICQVIKIVLSFQSDNLFFLTCNIFCLVAQVFLTPKNFECKDLNKLQKFWVYLPKQAVNIYKVISFLTAYDKTDCQTILAVFVIGLDTFILAVLCLQHHSCLASLQTRWKGLRDCFKRHLRRLHECRSGSGSKRFVPYVHAEELQFLRPFMELRETQSSWEERDNGQRAGGEAACVVEGGSQCLSAHQSLEATVDTQETNIPEPSTQLELPEVQLTQTALPKASPSKIQQTNRGKNEPNDGSFCNPDGKIGSQTGCPGD